MGFWGWLVRGERGDEVVMGVCPKLHTYTLLMVSFGSL